MTSTLTLTFGLGPFWILLIALGTCVKNLEIPLLMCDFRLSREIKRKLGLGCLVLDSAHHYFMIITRVKLFNNYCSLGPKHKMNNGKYQKPQPDSDLSARDPDVWFFMSSCLDIHSVLNLYASELDVLHISCLKSLFQLVTNCLNTEQ